MLRLFSVKIVAIIIVLLLPCSVIAKKRAVLFGGGCDSLTMDEDSFKPEFKKFVKSSLALRSRGWEVEGQYGRESQLDEFRKQSGISNANKATKNNLIEALDKAVNEMEKGDQFLLAFATHGSDGRENKRSHSICTETDEEYDRLGKKFFKDYGKAWAWENRDLLNQIQLGLIQPTKEQEKFLEDYYYEGATAYFSEFEQTNGLYTEVNDPEIVSRLRKLKAKGVKIGFIDDSCFGGQSLPLLAQFGCVVAATSRNCPLSSGQGHGVIDQIPALANEPLGLSDDSVARTLEDLFVATLISKSNLEKRDYETHARIPECSSCESWYDFLSPLEDERDLEVGRCAIRRDLDELFAFISELSYQISSSDLLGFRSKCAELIKNYSNGLFASYDRDPDVPEEDFQNYKNEYADTLKHDRCIAYLNYRRRMLQLDPKHPDRMKLEQCRDFRL